MFRPLYAYISTQTGNYGDVQGERRRLCLFKLPDANEKQLNNMVPKNESVHEGAMSLGCDRVE